MNTKQTLTLLMLANLVLLTVGIYLFQVVNPGGIVYFARPFIIGTNLCFLLANGILYRKLG